MSQLDNEVTVVITNKPDAELYAVFEDANFDVNVGESAKLQVNEAINYIQSGQAEIKEAVDEVKAEITAHAEEKTAEFDENANNKTSDFNDNYTDKLNAFNQNATEKTNAYNTNASDKTTAFNLNATDKTNAFNTNASDKTTAFNNNYTEKKALIDAEVQTAETAATNASNSADLAKQWAVGIPSEPTGYSAKHWAEEAASELSSINAKIPAEASASNQLADKAYVDAEDNSLQSQIDALVVASDVYDIVGTYAELQAYDISTVPVNDIIKVLVDSTHSNAATYYRCVETGGVKSWSYIGSEGAYYTKAETNTLLNAKQDTLVSGTNIKTVNGNSLLGSGDVNISAVASWGNITGTLSNQTDLQNALNAKANDSDVVKTTGVQTIAGVKTFTNGLERSEALGAGGSIVTELIDTNGKGSVQNASYYTGNTIYNRLQATSTTASKNGYIEIKAFDNRNIVASVGGSGNNLSVSEVTNSTTSKDIPTMGWVNNPATSTNVVHRTGDEAISGNKTFNDSATFKAGLELKPVTTATHGGYIDFHYAGSTADWTSRIIENASGILTILANEFVIPAVSTSDNSNHAATTSFVKSQDFATNTDVVHKSGNEEKNGSLTLLKDDTNQLLIKRSDFSLGTTPSSIKRETIQFTDSTDDYVGYVGYYYNTDGSVNCQLRCRKQDSSSSTAIFVGYDSSGKIYTSAPASDETNSIVTTTGINKSGNGYVKLGNGIIIQWGQYNEISGNTHTFTLPTPFLNNNYKVSLTRSTEETTTNDGGNYYIRGHTTTSFNFYTTSTNTKSIMWIAVGY